METPKKILLIEDNHEDFEKVQLFFQEYSVDFIPNDFASYEILARLVINYSRSNVERKEEFLQRIDKYLKDLNPDIVLIDVGLDGKPDSTDRSGLEIKNYIDKNCDPTIKKIIISKYENKGTIDCDGYIQKLGAIPIETQLQDVVISPYKIIRKNFEGQPKDIKVKKSYGKLTLLERYSIIDQKQISPWLSTILDKLITYIFYIIIATLFILAPIDIYKNAIKSFNPDEMVIDSFKIAERTFIAFLPFLIVCGFYIFYAKSLRSYFFKSIIDPRSEDFESSSILMKLSKKLFISSLLSYLFIKLIELLCFEKPGLNAGYFNSFYGFSNPFLQLYFTAGLVIILILYYIYIDRNHFHNNNGMK